VRSKIEKAAKKGKTETRGGKWRETGNRIKSNPSWVFGWSKRCKRRLKSELLPVGGVAQLQD